MPEFGDVKQVHLPEQKKLPGDETRFFKQGGESAGKSGDWISELGNAFEKSLEKLVVGAIKLPIDLADKALTGTAKGIVVGGKSILQGIGEAIKEIRSDIKDSKAAKAQFGEPRREQTSRQKDGQREAKSTPSPSPSARPGADSKNEHQNRAAESASPRERDSSQNNSLKYGQARPKNGPSSAMDPAQHKTWADAPSHAATSIKVQEHKEPTVRKYVEPAKDAAARTATPPDQSQTVKKEAEAPPIVRKDHATVETEQKKWEASDYKVSAEKTSVKTVDSVLQEIRAAREIPREKAKESERAPEKSAERTR